MVTRLTEHPQSRDRPGKIGIGRPGSPPIAAATPAPFWLAEVRPALRRTILLLSRGARRFRRPHTTATVPPPKAPHSPGQRDPAERAPDGRVRAGAGRSAYTGSTDCAVGSGEWAEPPHSPWTLRRRARKKADFGPPRGGPEGAFGARESCFRAPRGPPRGPPGHQGKPINPSGPPGLGDTSIGPDCAARDGARWRGPVLSRPVMAGRTGVGPQGRGPGSYRCYRGLSAYLWVA